MLAMLAPMQAFVLPSARAAPRKSIACVAQQPTGSGDYVVSRRSIAGHAAVCDALLSPSISSLTTLSLSPNPNFNPSLDQVGLAALGLLGQPAAWAVDTSAFEAKAAKYKAEREKRELTKPVVTSSVETAACVAGQLQCGPSGCLAEAGRSSGQPDAIRSQGRPNAAPRRF